MLEADVAAPDDSAVFVVEIRGDEFFDAAGFPDIVFLESFENGRERSWVLADR